jgi:hypothetical protein
MFKSGWMNWDTAARFVSRFGMRDVLTEGAEQEPDKRQNKRREWAFFLRVYIRRTMPQ